MAQWPQWPEILCLLTGVNVRRYQRSWSTMPWCFTVIWEIILLGLLGAHWSEKTIWKSHSPPHPQAGSCSRWVAPPPTFQLKMIFCWWWALETSHLPLVGLKQKENLKKISSVPPLTNEHSTVLWLHPQQDNDAYILYRSTKLKQNLLFQHFQPILNSTTGKSKTCRGNAPSSLKLLSRLEPVILFSK